MLKNLKQYKTKYNRLGLRYLTTDAKRVEYSFLINKKFKYLQIKIERFQDMPFDFFYKSRWFFFHNSKTRVSTLYINRITRVYVGNG